MPLDYGNFKPEKEVDFSDFLLNKTFFLPIAAFSVDSLPRFLFTASGNEKTARMSPQCYSRESPSTPLRARESG